MELLVDTLERGASVRATSRSVDGQLDMSFNVRAENLGTVRDIVAAHLCWWRVDDGTAFRMLTVVNELFTNVLQHTPADTDGYRMARLLLQKVPDGVTAIVRDQDRRPPVYSSAGPPGRGGAWADAAWCTGRRHVRVHDLSGEGRVGLHGDPGTD